MLPTFAQTLTLQEAFETAAQINEELKITEFDGAFCKKSGAIIGDGDRKRVPFLVLGLSL